MNYLLKGNIMIKSCLGCGVKLQNKNKDELGYCVKDNNLCERCFRIKHYNDNKIVIKDNEDVINILKEINKTNDLVLLLVDIFNLPINFDIINKYLNNDLIVVVTKYDLLKPYLKENKLRAYLNNFNLNILDTIVISSYKNYNLDKLLTSIYKYKKTNNVYVVGDTNAGKSTLINKIIYNYTNLDTSITTTYLPSTTLENIKIKINDKLTIIDTPGLIEANSIFDNILEEDIKKIVPKSVVRPKTLQIKTAQMVIIDKMAKLYFTDKTNITMYLSNNLKVTREFKKGDVGDFIEHKLVVLANDDIVIKGLGFIKVVNPCLVYVYVPKQTKVYLRKSLI